MQCGLKGTGIGLLAAGIALAAAVQPIAFPHNKHAAKGLECTDCHITADTGSAAGMPSVRKCMLCHRMVATKGPGVQKLLQYAKAKREVPWERVYGFEAGAEVKFQHAPHIRAKIECKTCHGEVEKMTVAQRAVRQTMGRCLNCHRERHATEDCAACHY
ncbi:MAG TPA: cytochrome c3 family protein [Bryobacteraceae bacterium]|nr:cytochrome c3 family protein [Bryobacteraceae bacterium]